MTANYFLQRIGDLEPLVADIPTELLQEDLTGLILDVLAYAGRTIDMEDLNRTLLARSHIDVETLRQSVTIFEGLQLDGPYHFLPSRYLDTASLLEGYRTFVDRLAEEAPTLGARRLEVRLNLDSDPLEYLLLCAASDGADLTPIIEIVRNKLNLVDEDSIVDVWSRIQSEFSLDRVCFMHADSDIIPVNWLRTTTMDDLKHKIAHYVVDLKPRLTLRMYEAGRDGLPFTGTPSVARLLSLAVSAAVKPISQVKLDLARSLGRLHSYWVEILSQKRINFHRALGLGDNISFADSQEHQGAVEQVSGKDTDTERLILYEVKKIVRATHSLSVYESPVEKALTQYKLGLEVMAPESIDDLSEKNELRLQKRLCRFLLERGIFAVGTKFGRSEIDLLAELPNDGYVIETKVYKHRPGITERTLKSNLTQLQAYMDQSPTRRRGILVIYNFTSTVVSAPRHWVGGRFWFLPINLQREPPSGRSRSLTIEAGDDLIRVLNIRPPTRARKTKIQGHRC